MAVYNLANVTKNQNVIVFLNWALLFNNISSPYVILPTTPFWEMWVTGSGVNSVGEPGE